MIDEQPMTDLDVAQLAADLRLAAASTAGTPTHDRVVGAIDRMIAEVRRLRDSNAHDGHIAEEAENEIRRLRGECARLEGENARLLQRLMDGQTSQ